MPRKKSNANSKRPIESYEHRDKERINNPPVGLVSPETDPDEIITRQVLCRNGTLSVMT